MKLTEIVLSSAISNSVSIVSNGNANISNNSFVSNTKPLIADSEHDVIVLEDCGLTIKIDKKLNLKTYEKKTYENYAGSKTRLDFLDKDFHGAGAHYAI